MYVHFDIKFYIGFKCMYKIIDYSKFGTTCSRDFV